MHTYRPTSELC